MFDRFADGVQNGFGIFDDFEQCHNRILTEDGKDAKANVFTLGAQASCLQKLPQGSLKVFVKFGIVLPTIVFALCAYCRQDACALSDLPDKLSGNFSDS